MDVYRWGRGCRRERESEREKERSETWNKCRSLSLSLDCRRADRLSRFHGRSFALLTAGRDRQTRTAAATSAILCQDSEERERERERWHVHAHAWTSVHAPILIGCLLCESMCVYVYIYWLWRWIHLVRFPFEKTRELLAKVNGVKRIDENSYDIQMLSGRKFFF